MGVEEKEGVLAPHFFFGVVLRFVRRPALIGNAHKYIVVVSYDGMYVVQ